MEKVILTQISINELRTIIREELKSVLTNLDSNLGSNSTDILNLNQVCEWLGISKSHMYKLTSRREIPFFKVGKRLFFDRTEVILWMKKGQVKTI